MKNKKAGQCGGECWCTVVYMMAVERSNEKVTFEQTQYRSDWVSHVDTGVRVFQAQEEAKQRHFAFGCLKNSKGCGCCRVSVGQSGWWWGQRDHKGVDYLRPWKSLLRYWYWSEWELKPLFLVLRVYSAGRQQVLQVVNSKKPLGNQLGSYWN